MNLKEKNQKPSELSIVDFGKIRDVFIRKNWPIENCFDDVVFENFCKMLANLNDEQRNLVISLTDKFLWVSEGEYLKYFSTSFNTFITKHNFSRGKKVCICPILPEEDFGKSKSSIALLYLVKAYLNAIQRKYSDFTITYADSPNAVKIELIKQDFTLCLIDDFIGTGETVQRAARYFLNQGITKEMLAIVSLVSMNQGLINLNNDGYYTYTDTICEKGLSFDNNKENIRIMNDIEQIIKVNSDYHFGYGASEALVRMMRTPNNTFPLYWLKNNRNKFAPFAR